MFRAVFSMFFWVILARWSYSEIQLSCPKLLPFIDYSLRRLQIPTHDKWPAKSEVITFMNDMVQDLDKSEHQVSSDTHSKEHQAKFFGASLDLPHPKDTDTRAQLKTDSRSN